MPAPFEQVLNQSPPYVDVDLYASDRPLADAVAANGGGAEAPALSVFGRRWGAAEMLDRGREANENPPKLKIFDAKGFRRDVVEFHPAYHQLMAESIAAGLAASTWRDDATPAPAPARLRPRAALPRAPTRPPSAATQAAAAQDAAAQVPYRRR